MIPVVVRHLAEADVEKARAWYASEDQRLGLRFAQALSRAVDRIAAFPDQFPEVGYGVRRALLHRFRYAT
jgi:plasmid stabilization system protein ParE